MDTDLEPRTNKPRTEKAQSAPSWPAFAAWGGGLIQIALGAGAITGEGASVAARAAGFLLLTLGLAALGWGLATLVRGHIVVPRTSAAGAVVGIVLAATQLGLDPSRTSIFAVAVASLLLLAVALRSVREIRRANGRTTTAETDAAAPRETPNANVLGIVVGALLVAALVTPALAATEAGQLAPDHGDHGMIMEPGHH